MKNRKNTNDNQKAGLLPIPDIDIIDLESGASGEASDVPATPEGSAPALSVAKPVKSGKKGPLSHVNIHVVLGLVFLLFIGGIIYKILNFGVLVDLDEIFKDGPGTYEDNFDTILPLFDAEGNPQYRHYGPESTILLLGNAPFADDRDSPDNLANMIREMTGATVYNCSVSGSYLAAGAAELDANANPWDIFNPYWLCSLGMDFPRSFDLDYQTGVAALGDDAPAEAQEVFDTLKSLDFADVDVVVLMYDGSDYLAGHGMYNDGDATDLTQFTGCTEATIELLRFCAPHIRVMVLSPAYAYGLDENGNYISSDIQRYGEDVLSTYVIKQYASCNSRQVTFVDNLYGTINEDQAKDYLTDHLHLNLEGRKKVAQRFVDALNYFSDRDPSRSATESPAP